MQERPRGVPNALRESRKVRDWPKGKLTSHHLSVGIIFIDLEKFVFQGLYVYICPTNWNLQYFDKYFISLPSWTVNST